MEWNGWTILAAIFFLFGIYTVFIFLLGLMFARRFQVEVVTDERKHEDQ